MKKRHQVVIVGGGPVGVALAVELGLRGIDCVVVEQRRHPQRIPKGQNLTQRSVEHFYFWGIADELRAARLLPPSYPMSGIIAYRDLNNEYWYAPPLREIVNSYYFQENERLLQYRGEYVLRARMAQVVNVEAGSVGLRKQSGRTPPALRSPSSKKAAARGRFCRPIMRSAATAAIRSRASRQGSSAAAPTSIG